MKKVARRWLAVGLLLALPSPAGAESLAGNDLLQALRQGGFVIYFRHAATEWSQQDRLTSAGEWRSCEPSPTTCASFRRRDAGPPRGIGIALRRLAVPVSRVLSSEYCRTRETALRLGLGPVETTRDVMNLKAADFVGGRDAVIERFRQRLSEQPLPGTNIVIVGHGNVVQAATGAYPAEAGAAIFRPRVVGGRSSSAQLIQASGLIWPGLLPSNEEMPFSGTRQFPFKG